MCLETQIRALAAEGKTRKQAAMVLGISSGKMKLISDSIAGLTWQRAKYTRVRRSNTVGQESSVGMATRRARAPQSKIEPRPEIFLLNGIEGTLIELMLHFKVMWTIATVRKRLATGMTLENAFTSGRPKIRDWAKSSW